MQTAFRPALTLFALITLLCGLAYPCLVNGIAQSVFPAQANGSLLLRDGKVAGSVLIGQSFSSAGYFWSRPSATAPQPNNGLASGGSNLGPLNPALADAVRQRVAALRAAHPEQHGPIPADLVTASASGLDPHLSPAAIEWQLERVAAERGRTKEELLALVPAHTKGPDWGVFGEPRVNVLTLNLALDERWPMRQ